MRNTPAEDLLAAQIIGGVLMWLFLWLVGAVLSRTLDYRKGDPDVPASRKFWCWVGIVLFMTCRFIGQLIFWCTIGAIVGLIWGYLGRDKELWASGGRGNRYHQNQGAPR